MQLSPRFDQALVYTSEAHRLQTRKSTTIPYLGHLLGVASIVIDHDGTEDEAIGALLHDAVEDQGGLERLADVRLRFGDAVATIVEGCSDSITDDPALKAPWRKRKEAYVDHLTGSKNASVYLVSAADKLHNLRSMLSDYAVVGEQLWSRFNRDAGKAGVLWYYASLVAAYRSTDDPRVARIAAELRATLSRLEDASNAATGDG